MTAEAIVEATGRIVAESGEVGVTVRAVAQRAGVGMGSLYRLFPTRDALLVAWKESLIATEVARMMPRIRDAAASQVPVADVLRTVVPETIAAFRRVKAALGPGGDQEFAVRYSAICQRLGGLFEAPLAHVLTEVATPGTIRPKRTQEAARVVLRTVGYLTMDCTLHPPPNEDAYVEEIADMLTRYLAVDR